MAMLLGTPVQSNAIQYKCSATKSSLMMSIMLNFCRNYHKSVETTIEVLIQLHVVSYILSLSCMFGMDKTLETPLNLM